MYKILRKHKNSQKGFTLIELIIVVTIIAILSGIVISLINTQAQRARATDAVTQATMVRTAQGLEAFIVGESVIPQANNGDPLSSTIGLDFYLDSWPNGFTYTNYGTSINSYAGFCLSAPMEEYQGQFFKYMAQGTCAEQVLRECTTSCASNSLTGCQTLEGISCL